MSKGCVLNLKMRDKKGSVVTDYSRYGNDGAVNGGVEWNEKGMRFDGSTGYLNCGNDASIILTGATAISGWVKTTETTQAPLISFANAAYPAFYPIYTNDMAIVFLGGNNYRYFNNAPTAINDGNWHNIVFVITGLGQNDIDNSKIYVDGTEQTVSSTKKTGVVSVSTNVYIGNATTYYLDGTINDVRIYNYALPLREIKAYYNETRHNYV